MSVQNQDRENLLANYKWTYLQCRVDRHLWQRDPAFDLIDPSTIERSQACRACSTVRYVWVDRYSFERVTNYRYRHAKGYLTGGTDLKLDDFRKRLDEESITTAFKKGKVHGALSEKLEAKREAKQAG